METTMVYWGSIGIMESKMEATMVYWDYIGITEKKMATELWPKPFEPFVLICCAIVAASRNTDAPKE